MHILAIRQQGQSTHYPELEVENARLRAERKLWREENMLLANLLARRFDAESGEIDSKEPEGEGRGPTDGNVGSTSTFCISDAAIMLFEALPLMFTLDEVLDRTGPTEAAQHLRIPSRMISLANLNDPAHPA